MRIRFATRVEMFFSSEYPPRLWHPPCLPYTGRVWATPPGVKALELEAYYGSLYS